MVCQKLHRENDEETRRGIKKKRASRIYIVVMSNSTTFQSAFWDFTT
ncbi:MAG: hypothetical protein JO297_20930 [Nitrososphaeraceae archaeon]|nr:hypothetical protein [Nitrososphaeraceae archaeon]